MKWRIIFPQDRIIVTLEKGKCLLSMVLILKKSGEYYLNFVKFRVLILKTTFYCLHKVKFETGGISPPVQSLDALNNMSGEENYSIFHNPIRQVHFDVDSQSNAEIISRLTTTLGKSKETLAEEAEKEAEKNNPANFGLNFG